MIKKALNSFFFKLWFEAGNLSHQRIVECFEKNQNAKVLDLGCDNGGLIIQKAKKGIGSGNIWGLDNNRGKLAIAKRSGLRVIFSDLNNKFPLNNSSFDVVHASQIIEHLENVDGFVEEIWRVLKPGGYAVIATENLSSWHNLAALVFGWQAFSQQVSRKFPVGNPLGFGKREVVKKWAGEHQQIFTIKGLRELFEIYQFKVEKILGAGYCPFWGFIANVLSRVDPTHAAFLVIKVRKKRV